MDPITLRVLIVEEFEDDAVLIMQELKRGGYSPTYERIDGPDEFERALTLKKWDVILSDYQLRNFGGFAALKILQRLKLDLPFILVAGTVGQETAIGLMKLGAHDFVLKSNLARLVPAVSRELRDAETRRENLRLQSVKDSFIETVSHELRTPLAIIKAATGNLKDGIMGRLSDKQLKVAETAMRNVDRLTRIINDLLDTAQLEASNTCLACDWTGLDTLVAETLETAQTASKQRLDVASEIAGDLPRFRVDADRISQALANILDNAFRFAKSRVYLRLRLTHIPPEGLPADLSINWPAAHITVNDDGPGIAAEDLPRLFGKFEQINRAVGGSGYRGTGLGLYIAREIVRLHRGSIWVQSVPGQGAQFHLLIPIDATGHNRPPDGPTQSFPQTAKRTGHILIVEDEKDLVNAVTWPLEAEGYTVASAADGETGLALARSLKPDLVLLDMLMPGLTGDAVCRELKNDPQTRDIPVVIFTAKVLSPDKDWKQETGANAIVIKPFLMEDLVRLIGETVDTARNPERANPHAG
jgi:signal transduction histidine kinase